MKLHTASVGALAAALAAIAPSPAPAQPALSDEAAPAQSLEGLWVAEQHLGRDPAGPITILPLGDGWMVRLRGELVPIRRSNEADGTVKWSFSFYEEGHFEGYQSAEGEPIEGHWFQPFGELLEYRFATPVTLEKTRSGAFTGIVKPLHERATLSIPLKASSETSQLEGETYEAFMREPERNLGYYWIEFHSAHRVGDRIRFAGHDGATIAEGRIADDGERISLYLERLEETFDFRRKTRAEAVGFHGRRATPQMDALPRPVEIDDGWRTAAPEDGGIDSSVLAGLIRQIADQTPSDLRSPYVHSLLIAHRGKLVMEEYFHGFDRNTPHDSRSAGKSVGSALVGIAIEQGHIDSVDQPIYPIFGGVENYANPDPRKDNLTLRHLLTMSSGLDCDDSNSGSLGHEMRVHGQADDVDLDSYVLGLPMVSEAGGTSAYCSASINLAAGAIEEASGQTLPRFFQQHFAKPLDIDYYQMNLSQGYKSYWGGGIRLTPRDFLKLGQIYLDGGIWNGRRIVSAQYVQESFSPLASLGDEGNYGLAWWRANAVVEGRSIEAFMADGNGGQRLYVVPELDLVVLLNAGNYSNVRGINEFSRNFMRDVILPAAIGASGGP